MLGYLSRILSEGDASLRGRLIVVYALLIAAQRSRLGLGAHRPARNAGSAGHGAARVLVRPAARRGRRPYRRDRQRHAQADAARSASGRRRASGFRSAIRPSSRRCRSPSAFAASAMTGRFDVDEGGGRHHQHERLGALPVRHRDRQHHGARLGLPHVPGGQAGRAVRRKTTSISCSTAAGSCRASSVRCSSS